MITSSLITGGNGPQRLDYTRSQIDKLISLEGKKEIIIYDATYTLICYINNSDVSYFCVDSVVSYVEKLKDIVERKKTDASYKTYILTDAYGGFWFAKENKTLFLEILENQEKYNIEVVMSARHMDFVPEEFINHFNKVVALDEIYTPLNNETKVK